MTSTARLRHGYALGSLASGTFGTVPGLLMLPYLTDTLGVGAALAGVIVFLPKAWDFFMNPIAGRLSDRVSDPRRRRRPFLLAGGLGMAVSFALMFSGPHGPTCLAAGWVLVLFVAGATSYALFQVPYLAMSAEITDSYSERTRMMSWRVVAITVTIMLVGATSPALVAAAPEPHGHRLMGAVMALLIVAGAVGVWWATRDAPMTRHEPSGGRLGEQLRMILGNVHARTLLAAFVPQAVAGSMLLAGVDYASRHLTGGGAGDATVIFVAFVGPAVLVTPLWQWVGLHHGKKTGLMLSSAVFAVALLALLVARTGNLAAVVACSALVGVGYAGCQLFPLAMLPDIAAHDARTVGTNRIGAFTGLWAGFELLGFALGPGLLGLILQVGDYTSSTDRGLEQSSTALWAMTAGLSVIPAALVLVSMLFLRHYRLDATLAAEPTAPEVSTAG
ncbi:MAG: MFS transporter [Nocardioides sp.]|nr:MFS transporter [Nocardioides sp.]